MSEPDSTADHWPHLHDDPYALARLKKSVALADVRPGMSVLDVGCHQEEARRFLPSCTYVGLDHLKGDDFDGGFRLHQKFDRILCLEVLEHLQFPKKTLASILEHLKDDGLAVISLPNEATLFHRIRSFLGTPDQEAFSECGKHLHLPNMKQSLQFLSSKLFVVRAIPYVSDGVGTRNPWIRPLLQLLPLELLSRLIPSLFARGFIFVCTKRNTFV